MNFKLIFKTIFLSISLLASLENSWAQKPQKAPLKILDIKKSSETDKKSVKIPTPTPDVKIYKGEGEVENGDIGSGIYVNNRLTVEKLLSVGLNFQNINQVGEFVLLTHPIGQKRRKYNGAEYKVQTGEKAGEIDIILLEGSARVKTGGRVSPRGRDSPFRVIAQKLKSVIRQSSTTIAMFSVSADTGMIFLEQGSAGALEFPDHETFPDSVRKTMIRGQIKQGDVVFFKGDQVTRHTDISTLSKAGAATAAAAIASALIDNANHYDKLFSKKPFWQKPKYYVPAALLITIPTILITTNGGKDLPGPPGVPVIHR